MEVRVSREDILRYLKLEIISQISLVKLKIKLFEDKYKCAFDEFEDRIREAADEDFEAWDDYIEWEAYIESKKDLERKLRELENVKDIKIT